MIEYSVDDQGIATIAWAMTDRPFNVMNSASIAAFAARVEQALADPAVRGVIVTSTRQDFVVGADLTEVGGFREPAEFAAYLAPAHRAFRRMETGGKPFVAALNGTALGGGLELALACHRRTCADRAGLQLGLPEVTLGLLPAAGGTQRLARLLGVAAALPMLVEGRKIGPAEARKIGLVDEVVPAEALGDAARRWLLSDEAKGVLQPWDREGARFADQLETPAGRALITAATAEIRDRIAETGGAPLAILSCVSEGLRVDFDAGLEIESSLFLQLMRSPDARNRIASFFALRETKRSRLPTDDQVMRDI